MQLEAQLEALSQALRARGPHAESAGVAGFAPRVDVYRGLVRDRLCGSIATTLPRTHALLGAARVETWVDVFLLSRGVRSPYFRDVALELAEFAASAGPECAFTDREVDTARFEAARFAVAVSPADDSQPREPLALDRPVHFSAAVRRLSARSAVHAVPEDIALAQTHLLIYRAPHGAHALALSDAAGAVLDALLSGCALAEGIRRGTDSASVERSAEVMAQISALLVDLGARGVVLGAG